MVIDVISSWWLFAIGISLFITGLFFKDYIFGISGGLLIFLQGLYILTNPVTDLSSMMNLVFGSVLFTVGSYIWVTASLDLLSGEGYF